MKKILLCSLLLLCLVLVFPRGAMAADIGGTCGENVQWVLKDGILTISGSGEITSSPWLERSGEIKELIIREGVTVIPDGAFANCANLRHVTVEPGVSYVGTGAFADCKTILMYWHGERPEFVSGWKRNTTVFLYYPEGNENWDALAKDYAYVGGFYLEDVSYALSGSCGANLTYTIDGTVMTISGTGEMDGYSSSELPPWVAYDHFITKLVIENGVTSIGANAFSQFDSITELVIPEGVTRIESMGFKDCSNLRTVSLPETMTHILDFAFDSCVSLQEIEIPPSVTHLYWGSLDYCTGLKKIYFYGDPPKYMNRFLEVVATAYYPADNAKWTAEVQERLGEGITWLPLEEPHEHTFGDWVQVKAPTTEETGVAERKCTSCDEVERKDIPKLEVQEPQPTEPKPTEPAPTEPKPTEPAPTEPTVTEPAPTEPTVTEPVPTEPAATEPTVPEGTTAPATQPSQTPTTQPEDTTGAPTAAPGTEPTQPDAGDQEEPRSILPAVLIAGVVILAGGAAAVWFFVLRKRK